MITNHDQEYDNKQPRLFALASLPKRIGAFVIDIILLIIIEMIIGWSFLDFFYSIGPYGRILGFVIALIYFSILDSRICNGQTFGKKLLKIAVRGDKNEKVSIIRSTGRGAIVATCMLLSGIPISNNIIQGIFSGIIISLFIVLAYTTIFNRHAGQGIHDMIFKTYVVNLEQTTHHIFPQSPKIHWKISSLITAITLTAALLTNLYPSLDFFDNSNIDKLYNVLNKDSRFFSVSVGESTTSYSGSINKVTRSLNIELWYKGTITKEEQNKIAYEIAIVILQSDEGIEQYQLLTIAVSSAFDLGIARSNKTYYSSKSISDWKLQEN